MSDSLQTRTRLEFPSFRQPDDETCGPTSLHAVYRFYNDDITLDQTIREIPMLDEGGTLASFLGNHALQRGYSAAIYTYNLRIFDPTWFPAEGDVLPEKLRARADFVGNRKLKTAIKGYLRFLEHGGQIRFEDLSRRLIRETLYRGTPIMTGLSSTFLYRAVREYGDSMDDDDIRGEPQGHFVVLCGYDPAAKTVDVADPLWPNRLSANHHYSVAIDRVIGAIYLGVLTYDANLLVIEPRRTSEKHRRGGTTS